MQAETKHSSDKMQISQRSTVPSRWLGEQITILAEAMGEALTPARLKIYAADLADLNRSQLEIAFARARRECRFFPKIAELRELAGMGEVSVNDAEMRAAWDQLAVFVRKYVGSDVHGNYAPGNGWYSKFPQLPDRISDSVRRSGGWKVYACMTDENFPFIQKRFFEEYRAWTAVERIDLSRLTAGPEPKRLK